MCNCLACIVFGFYPTVRMVHYRMHSNWRVYVLLHVRKSTNKDPQKHGHTWKNCNNKTRIVYKAGKCDVVSPTNQSIRGRLGFRFRITQHNHRSSSSNARRTELCKIMLRTIHTHEQKMYEKFHTQLAGSAIICSHRWMHTLHNAVQCAFPIGKWAHTLEINIVYFITISF